MVSLQGNWMRLNDGYPSALLGFFYVFMFYFCCNFCLILFILWYGLIVISSCKLARVTFWHGQLCRFATQTKQGLIKQVTRIAATSLYSVTKQQMAKIGTKRGWIISGQAKKRLKHNCRDIIKQIWIILKWMFSEQNTLKIVAMALLFENIRNHCLIEHWS